MWHYWGSGLLGEASAIGGIPLKKLGTQFFSLLPGSRCLNATGWVTTHCGLFSWVGACTTSFEPLQLRTNEALFPKWPISVWYFAKAIRSWLLRRHVKPSQVALTSSGWQCLPAYLVLEGDPPPPGNPRQRFSARLSMHCSLLGSYLSPWLSPGILRKPKKALTPAK